jgi:hypothetical protein
MDQARMADFHCPFYDQSLETEHGISAGAQVFGRRLKGAAELIIAPPRRIVRIPTLGMGMNDWL